MISERLIDVTQITRENIIMVNGQFRSYNRHEEMKNRLVFPYLREVSLWKKNRMEQRQIRFFWMAISANTGLPEDTSWKRDCRYTAGSEPTIWKI